MTSIEFVSEVEQLCTSKSLQKERKKEKDGKKERKKERSWSILKVLHLKGKSRNKEISYAPFLPKRIILADQMETYKNLQIFDV